MKKEKHKSILKKIIFGFIITIGVLGVLIFSLCEYYTNQSLNLYYKERADNCVKAIADIFYNTDFNKYLKNGKDKKYYEQLSILNSICKNCNLKYLYVFIPDFDKNEITCIFLQDGNGNTDIDNWDLGIKKHWKFTPQEKDAYNGINNPVMYNAKSKKEHTISSYSAIYNDKGEVTALIGADIDYNSVYKVKVIDLINLFLFIGVCLSLIYFSLISYLKIVFIKPVIDISKKMESYSSGNNQEYVPLIVDNNDELGIMSHSFNKMVDDINKYIQKVLDTQMETIFSLAKLAQSRDEDTGKHLERVKQFCDILARKLSQTDKYKDIIDETFIYNLVNASTLHDIGKVGISDMVLLKEGKLSDDKFEIIKTHTTIGYETLKEAYSKYKSNKFIQTGMYIALYHHERWDGTGYPKGLKGEEIPLESRIMSIADVYDALSSKRVYKPAFSHEKCVQIIKEGRGTQFDPFIVDIFLEVADEFERIRFSMND